MRKTGTKTATTRAGAVGELIPQPHGGALRPGPRSTGPAKRKPIKQITREMIERIADDIPESVAILGDIVRHDPDPRNKLVAIKIQLDALKSAVNEEVGGLLDLSHLSPAELMEAQAALDTLARLTGHSG